MLRQIDPPPAIDAGRHCGNCGYDLRGIARPRCPECGVGFNPAQTPLADVPWFHRRTVGHLAAVWRTAWLVMLRPRRFAGQVLRHDARVDPLAARRFRWVCVVVAAGSMALAIALHMRTAESAAGVFALTLPPILLYFALTAPLVQVTDFASASGAARFGALSEFSNAPLLLMPMVPLVVALCRATGRSPTLPGALLLVFIAAAWIYFKFLYQAWAAGRDLVWLVAQVLRAALVWAFFALICFALIAYTAAFTNRLFDW